MAEIKYDAFQENATAEVADINTTFGAFVTQSTNLDVYNIRDESFLARHIQPASVTREHEMKFNTNSFPHVDTVATLVDNGGGEDTARLTGAAGGGWTVATGEQCLIRASVENLKVDDGTLLNVQLWYMPNGGAATAIAETLRKVRWDDGGVGASLEKGRITITHLFDEVLDAAVDWVELRAWFDDAAPQFFTLGTYSITKVIYKR